MTELHMQNAKRRNPMLFADARSQYPGPIVQRPCGNPTPPCACFLSHSSGVKHFGVQACIAAISAFSAELTSRWRARVVFLAKLFDTIMASKA